MLDKINSVINGNKSALDKDKAFTFIEFIKCFGFENNPDSFLILYKEYLNKWAEVKSVEEISKTKEEYVREKMIDTLKSITLNYSSYEEQDFIAHIDWSNETQVAALIPLYVRKIMQICEFYRKKRNDAPLIVKKHNTKGSTKSIEQIVYDKIVDFVFENRNLIPQYANIRHDLHVSVEAFVDTYSEYFDIPRNPDLSDASRAEVLAANMNDVDYRDYLQIADVISDIIYNGEMYLKEIPLIASVGLNLSDECVGDLLEVKNELLSNILINLVPLNEQVDLKRKLYEKFLGCDLYYLYVDGNLNTYGDVLCKAKNPSGNLLNCGTADTATIQSNSLELLSNIGLYFKPDKCGILKVNARDYTWQIDKSAIEPDSVYVFPNPSMYGDIGTNKDGDYPLIMQFNLDYDIKNFTSGESRNDPLLMLGSPGWHSYYSKQEDIFEINDNIDYNYAFTSLSNVGAIHSYQTDVYGNQFGLFKGVTVNEKDDYVEVITTDTIGFSDFEGPSAVDGERIIDKPTYINLNGGYFINPTRVIPAPFNFEIYNYFDEYYKWTGIIPKRKPLLTPELVCDYVKGSRFTTYRNVFHKDNFRRTNKRIKDIESESVINDLVYALFSHKTTNKEVKVIKLHKSAEELDAESGTLFVRDSSSNKNKPLSITKVMPWLENDPNNVWNTLNADLTKDVISFDIMHNTIVIETSDKIVYIPYLYDGNFSYDEMLTEPIIVYKVEEVNDDCLPIMSTNRLFDEVDNCQYVLQMRELIIGSDTYIFPFIYKFDPVKYKFSEVIDLFDILDEEIYEEDSIKYALQEEYRKHVHNYSLTETFNLDNKIKAVKEFLSSSILVGEEEKQCIDIFKEEFLNSNYNLENFITNPATVSATGPMPAYFTFSKNSSLNRFLIAYIGYDKADIPLLYEHKFKVLNNSVLNSTLVTNVYSIKYKNIDGSSRDRHYEYADGELNNNQFFIKLENG